MANGDVAGNCVYCGRILFANGHGLTNSNRLVCDGTCQNRAELQEKVIGQIQTKTERGARYSGYFCYLAGLVVLLFGLPTLFCHDLILVGLGVFCTVIGLVFFLAGFLYIKASKNV